MTIRMERYRGELTDAAIAGRIEDVLRHHGARVSRITFEHVDHIARGAGGKAPRSARIDAEDAVTAGNG